MSKQKVGRLKRKFLPAASKEKRIIPVKLKALIMFFLAAWLLWACEPLVYQFDSVEDARMYRAAVSNSTPAQPDTLTIMAWNIRFGAGRLPWFGDACGERVILTAQEVTANLQNVAAKINEIQPDVLFLEEADVQSKRTAYIDEVQWLLDHTSLNYGAYGSIWKVQFIPSDGLGQMDLGTVILSPWHCVATRMHLPAIST